MKNATLSAVGLTLVAFVLLVFVGCSNEPTVAASITPTSEMAGPATHDHDDLASVRKVTVNEVRAALEKGEAVVVDVRSPQAYELEHIPGSKLMPFAQVSMRAGELPQDRLIVLYCTCPAEESSAGAAQMLARRGITTTAALVGGLDAWKAAGLPVETGPEKVIQ
jgi:rhodanese-related sulfurtransferase